MPFIERNKDGSITGLYGVQQSPDMTEWLEEDDPAVVAYRNPVVVPEIMTRWQFFAAAAGAGVITETEAQAAITGTMPQPFVDFIGMLPADQQFGAKMLLSGTQEFRRHHPFVEAFLKAKGMTDAQADAIWMQGAGLGS